MFKVPIVPRKIRKTQPNASPQINPSIIENVLRIANEVESSHETASTSTKSPSLPNSSSGPAWNAIPAVSTNPAESHNEISSSSGSKDVHAAEMQTLLNTVIDNNTGKMNDSIRTLMDRMLHEVWNAYEPAQQLQDIQSRLVTMRTDYEREIYVLKHGNIALKEELKTLHAKCDTQSAQIDRMARENFDLNDILTSSKLKMAAQMMDLNKSLSK